jgi:adenylate cyclase
LAALYAGAAYTAFDQASQWWPLVIPLALQWPAALALGLFVSHRRSRVERDRLHEAFGYFVPERVVKQLAQSPGKVAAAHRIAYGACLATDAERYTALAERLDPQALGETMNRYYAQLFGPVERHGGWVIDVIGDAMVAVWELASSDAERRGHACRAALAMQAALDAEPPGAPSRLPTRIGLHCGEMRIGTVGASQHYEFRAVGDAVNTASRLEGLNKLLGTRVLASAGMVAGVDGLLLRPLGRFVLAGKRDAVDVVEVVALLADAPSAVHQRCAAFADGLQHYRCGQAEAACLVWEAVLREDPGDGPARFYLARARRLAENPVDHDPASPITVATK